jgi:hypothetical protein
MSGERTSGSAVQLACDKEGGRVFGLDSLFLEAEFLTVDTSSDFEAIHRLRGQLAPQTRVMLFAHL